MPFKRNFRRWTLNCGKKLKTSAAGVVGTKRAIVAEASALQSRFITPGERLELKV